MVKFPIYFGNPGHTHNQFNWDLICYVRSFATVQRSRNDLMRRGCSSVLSSKLAARRSNSFWRRQASSAVDFCGAYSVFFTAKTINFLSLPLLIILLLLLSHEVENHLMSYNTAMCCVNIAVDNYLHIFTHYVTTSFLKRFLKELF